MSTRPSVLHVAAVQYTVEHLLLPQLEALEERGFDVRVACALDQERISPTLARFGPIDVRFPRSPRPHAMVRALGQILAAIRHIEPDIVHLHSPAAALIVRAAPRPLLPAKTKILYTVHGFAHQWDSHRRRDRVLERAEFLLSHRTDLLLFQSQEDLSAASQHGYRSQLRYLGNGVEDEWFAVPHRARSTPMRLLYLGRLVREKGLLDLLDATERTPEVVLGIAGAQIPSERDGVADILAQRAADPGLAGRVHLLGSLSKAALRAQMERCDAVVLPSYREGLPRSVIEALAAGRPVVTTNIRGCRELVQHGTNGLLITPGAVDEMAGAFRTLSRMSDAEYTAMCHAARARATASFRESIVFDRLVAAYEAVATSLDRRC